MNSSAQVTLLRGLIRMRMSDSDAYESLLNMLNEEESLLQQRLYGASDTITIYRLQGGIRAIKEILEYVDNPNELIRKIEEQNLS